MMGLPSLLAILVTALLAPVAVLAQLSNPITHESHVNTGRSKYLQNTASMDAESMPVLDEEKLTNSQCPQHLELRWQSEVSSSIYATPLVADIDMDGHKEVVVPSFVHYLEVLEGLDGERLPGWPAYHKSSVHTSPLLYDIDGDGMKEVVMSTYNGEILFFKAGGQQMHEKLTIPRLRVKKDWYVGLDPDHIDHSNPDVHDPSIVLDDAERKKKMAEHHQALMAGAKNEWDPANKHAEVNQAGSPPPLNDSNTVVAPLPESAPEGGKKEREPLPGGVDQGPAPNNGTDGCEGDKCAVPKPVTDKPSPSEGEGSAHAEANNTEKKEPTTFGQVGVGVKKPPPEEATAAGRRRHLLQDNAEGGKDAQDDKIVPTVEMNPEGELDDEGAASFELFREQEDAGEVGLPDDYQYDYDDYVDDHAWSDPDWEEEMQKQDKSYIGIDSHILCTPVIADIDADGVDELVVAASYFFDREYYGDPAHKSELPEGVDIGKYIAGAIVVFNLETRSVKWHQHLDLTTDGTPYRAYIYSSPTLVDIDKDGRLEIIVGTSVGFLYALNSDNTLREGFPKQMGDIQGHVLVADVNGDGYVELVAGDTRGNIAVYSWRGELLWDRHLASLVAQGATAGDVDGDGRIDIVVGTSSGHIYVMQGHDGTDVKGFPFRTHGRIMAPIALFNLKSPSNPGLDLAVVSFDGYLYVVDGRTACADVVDVGETSYSMVLAENIDGGEDLELLVSTMNGNVYCFQTPAVYHPLKAWTAQAQGRNVLVPRESNRGIYILPGSREYRDVGSASFLVQYEIVDHKDVELGSRPRGSYTVQVTLVTPGTRWLSVRKTYNEPSVDVVRIPCPLSRTRGQVIVEMTDEHHFYYSDEFSLTFHMHFYRVLKWILVLPLLAVVAVLVAQKPEDRSTSLPVTRGGHDL